MPPDAMALRSDGRGPVPAPTVFPGATVALALHDSVPILSCFTGLGLLDLGFMQVGWPVVWHNELDHWFIQGFEHAMSALADDPRERTVQNTRSILDLEPKAILDEAFDGLGPPAQFGMIGGPPCPDFSVAGKNIDERQSELPASDTQNCRSRGGERSVSCR